MRRERGRHSPFPVQDGAIVTITNRGSYEDFTRVGMIEQIDTGGLSFAYYPVQEAPPEGPLMCHLFGGVRSGSFLYGIPCKIISDLPFASTSISLRTCGIAFEELTEEKKALLHDFIMKSSVAALGARRSA